MTYYITGDCHRNFDKVVRFCQINKTTKEDVMIILGDAGINLALDEADKKIKRKLQSLPISFFMVHGNHEERPELIDGYITKVWNNGVIYYEKEFSDLLFAKDGEIYEFDGKKVVVIGGAYSVDKEIRLLCRRPWFESEQPSAEIKAYVEQNLDKNQWEVDYVLSHTCPLKYEPTDLFLRDVDQSKVDKSTEEWLSIIANKLSYKLWYFGHYHDNRVYSTGIMLYEEIRELCTNKIVQRVGRPKYKMGQWVSFDFNDGKKNVEKYGRIAIVDAYGSFSHPQVVSYDIEEANELILYKHIPETDVFGLI